jgi:cytochrome c553
MRKYSQAGNNKYLLPLIFLLFFISPAFSNSIRAAGKSALQVKDSVKTQKKDTSQVHLKDSSKVQLKDSTKVHVKDSLNLQAKDSVKHQIPDSAIYKRTNFSTEELIRGERLFFGLVYLGDKSVNCASCHNTHVSDTLNWNPDALEISIKYLTKSSKDLSRVLLKPVGPKMKLVHKGFQLTAEDIVLIKAYMNKFVTIGLKQNKPVITNLLLLIIAVVLFLISATDVIIKKIFKNQRINWSILTVTGIFITWILAVNAIAFGRSKGYAPAQPIKFSHAVHAGQNKTDCNYCHYTARTSKTAGIPPGSVCLNCHFLVRNGTRSGATEIAKVLGALDEKRAVQWVRIYRLPDFVFFSHEQHVSAGGITCDACHGNVKEMNRLYQVPDLSMGWCINCHKTRKVNLSNEYYKTYYSGFCDSLKAGKIDSVMVTGIGGRDCGKCHY